MNGIRPAIVTFLAGALVALPATAQHPGHDMSSMPGMAMPPPKPPAKKPAVRKAVAKAASAKPAATKKTAVRKTPARSARPATHAGHAPARAGAATQAPSATHDMSSMPGMDPSAMHDRTSAPADAGHDTKGAAMSAKDHGAMNHGEMDHAAMDHAAMHNTTSGDLPADAAPREPVPVLTDSDRAAAFPQLATGHAAHDARIHTYWLADRLEVRDGARSGAWEGLAWIGGDVDRVWLRSEGDIEHGRVERGDLEVLYGHSITPWWDVVTGVKHGFGEGPSRTYAAFGVQGIAPYKFEVGATAYVGNGGRTAATVEAEYDTLITNRLILQWQGEANLYGRADPAIGVGSGLSTVEAGARLRYEFTRRFAPYIGVELERAFGGTADLRHEAGKYATDTRAVAGIRFWF